jgi:hypothetical protein
MLRRRAFEPSILAFWGAGPLAGTPVAATHNVAVHAPDPTIHASAWNDERRMALLTPMHPVLGE